MAILYNGKYYIKCDKHSLYSNNLHPLRKDGIYCSTYPRYAITQVMIGFELFLSVINCLFYIIMEISEEPLCCRWIYQIMMNFVVSHKNLLRRSKLSGRGKGRCLHEPSKRGNSLYHPQVAIQPPLIFSTLLHARTCTF